MNQGGDTGGSSAQAGSGADSASGGADSASGGAGATSGSGNQSGGQAGSATIDMQSGGAGGLAACPGSAHPMPSCRTQADCPAFAMCVASPPTGAGTCGACFPTTHACTTDDSCGADQFCGEEPRNPCQCMGPSTRCFPKCTANSCMASEVCGASGRCIPKSCQDGYACPEGTVCDATRAGDAHQCAPARCDFGEISCAADQVCDPTVTVPASHCRAKRCGEGATCAKNHRCNQEGACERLKCTTDADCECGACISGACQDRLYMCYTLPA